MFLAHLSLTNFRNYSRLEINLAPGITLLQGGNAQGKTSFLEAMAFLSTSRSLLASAERELVNWLAWDEPLPFARLVGDLDFDGRKQRVEITIMQVGEKASGSPLLRKEVRINGVNKRAIDLVGQMPTVLFLPQDIELISGSPSVRRRYLDIALCQMYGDYCRSLSAYNKVLQQRNALLKSLRERGGSREQLAFWDEQMVRSGSLLMAHRAAFLADLEAEANLRQQALTDGRERLHIQYLASVDGLSSDQENSNDTAFSDDNGWFAEAASVFMTHDQQEIAAVFQEELARGRSREVAAGMSLVGPHRDDVGFVAQGRNLRTFGSRGQQRTAALAVKLAEVAIMRNTLGAPPLLLLDDVMSELDSGRRGMLLEALDGVKQAVVTTTDWGDFTPRFRATARCYRVAGGCIEESNEPSQPE
ncbi:MAG: DNA replication/repair protein RecF [Anaerolineae bacterium]|nr:DNA replication/repair protein RecF [Anaerolineae bacterium]